MNKNHSLTPQEIIAEIIDCAIKWISEDADYPDTPPEHWQEVIQVMEYSCDIFTAAQDVVTLWSNNNLASAVRQLSQIVELAKEDAA